MISCAIVEDEKLAMERLERLLKEISTDILEPSESIEITFTAKSCKELEKLLKKYQPDVLFLDIQLLDAFIFDIIDTLKELEYEVHIVFVTAYDDYAVKAFEEGAIDYILKPVTKERLEITVKRILRTIKKENKKNQDNLLNALEYLRTKIETKKIPIKIEDDIILVPASEIIYIEGDNKDVIIVTQNQRYKTQLHLYNLEDKLKEDGFIRIHKSYLISKNHIRKVKKWFAGSYLLEMSNGDELKISRTYQKEFFKLINYEW